MSTSTIQPRPVEGAADATASWRGALRGLIKSMRPRQWIKNVLVFVALFFTVNIKWDLGHPADFFDLLLKSLAAFAVFCVVAGAHYLVNDLFDRAKDRLHPVKRLRPIAAGVVPVPLAWTAALVLLTGGLVGAFALDLAFGAIVLGYIALSLGYDVWFKHVVILDVLVLAMFYVIRAVAGAAAIEVPVSPWLYICTLLLALMVGLCKRRAELELVSPSLGQGDTRPSLTDYDRGSLDQFISVISAMTLMAYTLYTFTAPNLPANHLMMLTIPVAIYGLFRYLYLVRTGSQGERPEELLLTDRPLLVSLVIWGALAGVLLVSGR